jgi:hypothetical protein
MGVLSQDNCSLDLDSNSGPPEHKAGVPTTRPQSFIMACFNSASTKKCSPSETPIQEALQRITCVHAWIRQHLHENGIQNAQRIRHTHRLLKHCFQKANYAV